jgi:AcrR family transcriptional regulator
MVDEPRKRGRKRLHEDDAERRMLLSGAMVVLQRNGWAAASITDILEETGLSRRAFYRHFESKDELLIAVCQRDCESVVRHLRARIDAAGDPLSAIRAFTDEFLAMSYDPDKIDRQRAMSSEGAQRAAGYAEQVIRGNRMFIAPLTETLRSAHAAGIVHSPDPEQDAMTILYIIQSTQSRLAEPRFATREEATAHVLRFAAAALGVPQLDPLAPA